MPKSNLIFHIGYPKTATSTLQIGLFPKHPEIEYLGKFIPSFRFSDQGLYEPLHSLMVDLDFNYKGEKHLKDYFSSLVLPDSKKATIISSENFIHPWSQDPSLLSKRLAKVAKDAKIAIVLREQTSLLSSFYHSFGVSGQYLYVHKDSYEPFEVPLTIHEWCEFQFRAPSKNMLGLLEYDKVIAAYERAFGAQNVKVFVYENLVCDEAKYYEEWADFLGIDPKSTKKVAMGTKENSFNSEDEFWNKATIEKVEFLEKDKARIKTMFSEQNRELDERLKLGLKSHGYY